MNKPTSQGIRSTSSLQMIKISAYGDLSFFAVNDHSTFWGNSRQIEPWFDTRRLKISCWAMSERDQVYADEYNFFVVKTAWKWKRTFQFNLQIQKKYIICYHIWFILSILEQVFQMAHKQIVPSWSLTPTLFFDIELVVYNHIYI